MVETVVTRAGTDAPPTAHGHGMALVAGGAVAFASEMAMSVALLFAAGSTGWAAWEWVEAHQTLLTIMVAVPFVVVFVLMVLQAAETDFYDDGWRAFNLGMLCLATFAAIIMTWGMCAGLVEGRENEAFTPDEVTSVVPDSGKASHATVDFTMTTDTGHVRECSSRADQLGYTDVVVDDSVATPTEHVEPDGRTLVIPRSLLDAGAR